MDDIQPAGLAGPPLAGAGAEQAKSHQIAPSGAVAGGSQLAEAVHDDRYDAATSGAVVVTACRIRTIRAADGMVLPDI